MNQDKASQVIMQLRQRIQQLQIELNEFKQVSGSHECLRVSQAMFLVLETKLVCLSIRSSVCLSVRLSVCPSVYLSVRLSVCLYVCLFIYQSVLSFLSV